ncbi:MAG: iron uptake system protein EfeO [Tumebacillaceae bacterium]
MKKVQSAVLALAVVSSLAMVGCSTSSDKGAANTTAPATNTAQQPAKVDDSAALKSAIDEYRKYVVEQSDALVTNTTAFANAIKAGDTAKAKALYPTSRENYERIEPIAESFGDLDPDIDARENDVAAADWKGFHVLEKALWQPGSVKDQGKVADELLKNVSLLRAKVETAEIDPALFVTGAVELLNEVSKSKVSGEEDRYSHTDLYDFEANVEGAQKIYELLKPTLSKQNADLSTKIGDRFNDVLTALSAYKKGEDFVSYTVLTKEQTKQLSQAVDGLAEPLSQMGTVLGVQGNGTK